MRHFVTKSRDGAEHRHGVYTEDEATKAGIEYLRAWRDGEAGDWVLSDDGQVVQVLSTGTAGRVRWLRTCTGTFSCAKSVKLTTEERENRFSFSGKGKGVSGTTRISPKLRDVLSRIASGTDPVEAYLSVYEGTTERSAASRIGSLLNTERIQSMLSQEREKLLDAAGLSKADVLASMKRLMDGAKNESVRLGVIRDAIKMHGLDVPSDNEADPFAGQLPALPSPPESEGEIEEIAKPGEDSEMDPDTASVFGITDGDDAEEEGAEDEREDRDESDRGISSSGIGIRPPEGEGGEAEGDRLESF